MFTCSVEVAFKKVVSYGDRESVSAHCKTLTLEFENPKSKNR